MVEVTQKTELTLQVDAEKIEAIKKCLEKGTLKITMTRIDILGGDRTGDPYLYD